MYVLPIRKGWISAGCAAGCGGAGHALITSGSRLLLFLVSPLFNLNGLLRSIGLSLPTSAPLGTCRLAVVISAEILGSRLFQGLWCTAESFEGRACGRGDVTQPVCAIGVLIAVILRTFPPLAVESKEVFNERKSFSGTAGGGGGVGSRYRITGSRLRRFRSQKYVNMATAIRATATGIIASPAIDADERPCLSCGGAAGSDVVAGIVASMFDMVFAAGGIVNCCEVDIVACCIRSVGKGDSVAGNLVASACWNCATTSVAVCDADRPSICTRRSIERCLFMVGTRGCASPVVVRHQRTTAIDERGPLQISTFRRWNQRIFGVASTKMRFRG